MDYRFKSNRKEFKNFGQYFDKSIAPHLHSLEGERKTRMILGMIFAITLIPVGLYAAWYFGYAHQDSDGRAIHLAYLIPMAGYMIVMYKFRNHIKFFLAQKISKFLGWQHSSKIHDKDFTLALSRFGVVPKHTESLIDDILSGHHEGWPFVLREVDLGVIKGSGKNRRRVSVFRGFVLSFDMKYGTSGTAAITRHFYDELDRQISENQHEGIIDHKGTEIYVRASNKDIIDTVMCARFQQALFELSAEMPDMDISCAMFGNQLHIPIAAENMFEVDWMFQTVKSNDRVQKLVDDFSYVLSLLDIILKRRHCIDTGRKKYPAYRDNSQPKRFEA